MQPLQQVRSATWQLIFTSPGHSVSPWEKLWRAVDLWMFILSEAFLSNASHLLGLSQGVTWAQADQPKAAVFALWKHSWRRWLSKDSGCPLCIMYGNSSRHTEGEQKPIVISTQMVSDLEEASCLQCISLLPSLVLATRESFLIGFQEIFPSSFEIINSTRKDPQELSTEVLPLF